jgi:UDP-glucose 4-epimerase
MNIVIIGSKGFIGSHCSNHFKSKGHHVIGCDIVDSIEKNYF